MSTLAESVKDRLGRASRLLSQLKAEPRLDMIGRVERVGDNVASVRGLPETRLGELLLFDRSDGGEPVVGIVLTLDPDLIGCAMLGDDSSIEAGNLVRGTGSVASVPVGDKLLGRIVNALGVPVDGGPEIEAAGVEPVERPAPAIVDRDFVDTALNTGLLVIDAMLPLGRGQRELIIGDRETGKTAIAIDTIINQRDTGVVCIYCAVGQKTSSVSQVIDAVKRYGAPERCIFVFAPADDPPGIQWLAPYAACTMAEYFSERGGDALLIIDDLSKHAVIYRQLSLLLRNPPGREAYPGDIFYIHSRLLERAAKLNRERGGGSLTALPHRCDGGRQSVRLHSNQSDFDHRRADRSRAAVVSRRTEARRQRRQERVARRRQDAVACDAQAGRKSPPRIRAIPRTGNLHTLRRDGG